MVRPAGGAEVAGLGWLGAASKWQIAALAGAATAGLGLHVILRVRTATVGAVTPIPERTKELLGG